MTVPTAKGEHPPAPAVGERPQELQEERRLAYVGITWAEQRLHLTRAVAAPGNRRVRRDVTLGERR